jgi:hypothetical protein
MKITLREALRPYLDHQGWPSLEAADKFTDDLAHGRITGLDYRPYEYQYKHCRWCDEEITKRIDGHVTHNDSAPGPWHSIWQNGNAASARCSEQGHTRHTPERTAWT